MKEITDSKQKTMNVYDNLLVLFLNEEEVAVTESRQTSDNTYEDVEVTKYQYDYYEVAIDGKPSRDTLIDAAIRAKYSASNQTALVRHKANGDEGYDEEWKTFVDYCESMKLVVDEYLAELNNKE